MEDLISVIVPVYNVREYLAQCIESICRQSYERLEIILIDDGSTDGSGSLCDSFAESDERIKVLHKENGGLSSARNAGIRASAGKYLSFVDSDDYIAEDMIAVLYRMCQEAGTKVACCDYELFTEEPDPEADIRGGCSYDILEQVQAMKVLFSMNHYRFLAWNKLYERAVFDDICFPEGKYYEDIWPVYTIFKGLDKVAYCRQKLYYYRFRPTSISKSSFGEKDFDLVEFIGMASEDCRKNFPEAKEDAAVSYIYYVLSFVNKAVAAGVPLNEEKRRLKEYIRHNIISLPRVKGISFARKMQVYLYACSVTLYSAVYRMVLRRKHNV